MVIKRKQLSLHVWLALFWSIAGGALLIYGHSYGHSSISVARVITVFLLGASLTYVALNKWPDLARLDTPQAMLKLLAASAALALFTAVPANLLTFFLLDHASVPIMAYAWDYLYFLLFCILAVLGWSVVANHNSTATNYISFTDRGHLKRIPAHDIQYIKAEGDYVELVCENDRHLYHTTIRALEQDLRELGFRRVHRGFLVNAAHVRNVQKSGNLRHLLIMANEDEVPVSRSYANVAQDLAIP